MLSHLENQIEPMHKNEPVLTPLFLNLLTNLPCNYHLRLQFKQFKRLEREVRLNTNFDFSLCSLFRECSQCSAQIAEYLSFLI